MSESSYRRMRALGVASRNTSTCMPQAFDRITIGAGVSKQTYQEYGREMNRQEKPSYGGVNTNTHNATLARLYRLVSADLGGYGLEDYTFEVAKRASRITRVLHELFDTNMNPTVSIMTQSGDTHELGVKQLDTDRFSLVGTGTPPLLQGPISGRDIEHFILDIGNSSGFKRYWPFQATNISALPQPTPDFIRVD